jgi:TatD DNase family protein
MLIDTHAHLDYPEFEADFRDVLNRADAAGVKRIISIGTSIESSRRAVLLAENFANIFAVIGVHPSHVEESEEDVITPLRELAAHPRVVAIGETGLDYHRLPSAREKKSDQLFGSASTEDAGAVSGAIADGAYKNAQAALFEQQLDLAAELGLNVVIHQRAAWDDTLAILKGYTGKLRAVFHCFGENFERAQEVITPGHLVSFTGIVTFKNAPLVQECAARLWSEHFMLETDCPYLAPAPFRGKRCEPAHTRLVAEKIAALRGETLETVAENSTRNALGFFRFPRS